jgi:predicted dehydrogenase
MRTAILLLFAGICSAQQPLRVAIAGLVHGHVSGFLNNAAKRNDIQAAAIFDPDAALVASYGKRYNIPANGQFTDLARMLDAVKPEAVATFTSTIDHAGVVEAAAQRHIPVMMEKPLAVDMNEARRIQKAAARAGIPVIVNYETTWYRSHGDIWNLFQSQKAMGDIRKMVAMDGHEGPQEIHVQPEFFAWLTDPVKNGAGAMFDFGCYGANLMTWMMDNQRPRKVTAIAQTDKPQIYPKVDDEATILVEYPKAQGIIQGSWNWPFARKDFEVYGATGYAIATGGNNLRVRLPGQKAEELRTPGELPPDERDSISYLTAVVRGRLKPAGLSSLENNMIVTEILSAARESVRTGKTITLPVE